MARLIDFKLDGNTTVLVEAANDSTPKGQQLSSAGGTVEIASKTLDETLSAIKPVARTIMAHMREAVTEAEEIHVEFGIKLTATAGIILAKAATEGHCKISVKWKRKTGGRAPEQAKPAGNATGSTS